MNVNAKNADLFEFDEYQIEKEFADLNKVEEYVSIKKDMSAFHDLTAVQLSIDLQCTNLINTISGGLSSDKMNWNANVKRLPCCIGSLVIVGWFLYR